MSNTYTPLIGQNTIGTGNDIDTWGDVEANNKSIVEQAIKGVLTLSVSGSYSLAYTNDATDQSHFAVLNIANGAGGTITLQPTQGQFTVYNGAAGDVVFTMANASAVAVVHPGACTVILNDGVSAVRPLAAGGVGVSDKLAELNVARFRAWKARTPADAVPAALAFAGDVYTGLKARELDAEALGWAQDRLRILSGLYGLLRPLDAIQPYRLEMGIRLANGKGEDLYAFWRERVTAGLNRAAKGHADPTLVNLASQEYFGAVDRPELKGPLVACHFREQAHDGTTRMIALYAKRARGLMARYAIDHRLERAEGLKGFNCEGYRFAPDLSGDMDWTFTRPAH